MKSLLRSPRLAIACSGIGEAAAVRDRMKRRERAIKLNLCIVAQVGLG
jgi:hypothetical protein